MPDYISGMAILEKRYNKKVKGLIGVFFFLRCLPAFFLELGNDESYYWLFSTDLRWNYFDHPPLIAIWIKLFTLNGSLDHLEGFVRAGSLVSCAFSTWFIYKAMALIHSERAGWFAAVLLNISLYAGLVAGVMILPDAPQLFFWTLSLWQIARLTRDANNISTWVLFGIAAGLCIMSKVHGVFIWTGLGLYILFKQRNWLTQPGLYISLLLTLIIISPLFFWNLEYDFITWKFHSARVDITTLEPEVKEPYWQAVFLQVLTANPVNIILIISALWYMTKGRYKEFTAIPIYNFIALPLVILLLLLPAFRNVWFHWSGPAYITLLPLAAVHLSSFNIGSVYPTWLKAGTAYFVVALIGWIVVVKWYPGTYGDKRPQTLGYGDISLDKHGWDDAGDSFTQFYQDQLDRGLSPNTPILCGSWWGAHLEYYFAEPGDIPVIGLGNLYELHHYAWLNTERLEQADMDTAFYIRASLEEQRSVEELDENYSKKELLTVIPATRRGKPAFNFYIYRLSGWKGKKASITQKQ